MVTKNIIINHGDEYRAKIEKNFQKDDFSFESYQRAAKCVSEIVNDALDYIDAYDNNNNGHAFYDYGNNIVAFCAERGQGKTSAMLSFSGELERFGDEKDGKKYNNILEFDFQDEHCFFEVLESIDPTMINNGIGILKVFLSRLFYHFQSWLNDRMAKGKNFELSNNYQKMLTCFKKCYTNIEYLQESVNKEWNLNDLDMLSQIGDSSNLKNNIYNLITLYFEITHNKKNDNCFLVVQIDDADLAIGNASDICENVRKFLKIPGIIVLMAADYEQLKHVFNQKYHKEYEKLVQYNLDFHEKCEKMASKYLEKILPHSHRIELPKLQNIIGEKHANLKVDYKVNGKSELFAEFKGCNDIQEQLIRLIYLRTGIILMKSEEKMHPFLPCRLRELTHLIKLLSDMESVDHNCIFELAEDDEKRVKLIGMLQRNLRMFKSYFMRDWCVNRLKQSDQELISKINELKINESIEGEADAQIYRILAEYLKKDCTIDKGERTHKRIINELIINELSDQPELQSALCLYYSIYLNTRFSYAFENKAEYQRIIEWLDYPIEVPSNIRNKKYGNKYYFSHFEFDYTKAKKIFKKSDNAGLTKRWFELFCRAKLGEKSNVPKSLFVSTKENTEEIVQLNEEITIAEFDVLQPLNTVFYKGLLQDWRREARTSIRQPNDSLEDIIPGRRETVEKENLEVAAMHKVVKNIIANYDVQRCLMGFLEQEYQYVHLRKNAISWRLNCLDIYADLDEKYNQTFGILHTDGRLQTIFEEFFNLPRAYTVVFLSNNENSKAYLNEYKQQLQKAINIVLDFFKSFKLSLKEKSIADVLANTRYSREETLVTFQFLDQREKVADVNEKVQKLWDIEKKIMTEYSSVWNEIEKGGEELKLEIIQSKIKESESKLNRLKNDIRNINV